MCHMRAQALGRIRATPGFADRACAAHEEYQAQVRDAQEAVHAFCEAHGQAERLSWRHRPDLQTVSVSTLRSCSLCATKHIASRTFLNIV